MQKQLFRYPNKATIGGVCHGLAVYFNLDVSLVRVLFVVGAVSFGTGALAYLIMWAVLPEKPVVYSSEPPFLPIEENEEVLPSSNSDDQKRATLIAGFVVLGIGVLFLLRNFIPEFHIGKFWPVILIIVGGAIVFGAYKNKND